MLVKVMIKRRFREGNTKEIVTLLNELRSGAMQQPGYVSGETLVSQETPQHLLVIATWQQIANWEAWRQNSRRAALEQMLEVYQSEPTVCETYFLGALPAHE